MNLRQNEVSYVGFIVKPISTVRESSVYCRAAADYFLKLINLPVIFSISQRIICSLNVQNHKKNVLLQFPSHAFKLLLVNRIYTSLSYMTK